MAPGCRVGDGIDNNSTAMGGTEGEDGGTAGSNVTSREAREDDEHGLVRCLLDTLGRSSALGRRQTTDADRGLDNTTCEEPGGPAKVDT